MEYSNQTSYFVSEIMWDAGGIQGLKSLGQPLYLKDHVTFVYTNGNPVHSMAFHGSQDTTLVIRGLYILCHNFHINSRVITTQTCNFLIA